MKTREHARRELRRELAEIGLGGVEDLVCFSDGRLIEEDARSRVTIIGPFRNGRSIIVKCYRALPHLRWRTIGRPSRARREYRGLLWLRRAGAPAVEPLGWFERRRRGIVQASILVTRYIPSADLRRVLRQGKGITPRGEPLDGVAARMVETVRALHDAGVSPRTLFDKNVLLPLDPADPSAFYLCDTPYVRRRRAPVRRSARIHDLACMAKWWRRWLEPGACVALILAYYGHRSLGRRSIRDLRVTLALVDRIENRTLVAAATNTLSRFLRKRLDRRPRALAEDAAGDPRGGSGGGRAATSEASAGPGACIPPVRGPEEGPERPARAGKRAPFR